MPIQTWFTNPSGGFSSFYMYDTDTKNFVRIRLELNREPTSDGVDNGYTKIVKRSNRVVAFSTKYDRHPFLRGDEIYVSGSPVPYAYPPNVGMYVYDCSVGSGRSPHLGNPVILTPILPAGIDSELLSTIASHYITGNDIDEDLTPPTSNVENLVARLIQKYDETI